MFRNYLTVALRHLRRHKVYTVINVSGLAIGIAFCVLTFLFVLLTVNAQALKAVRANPVDALRDE